METINALIITPLRDMMTEVMSIIPTLLSAVFILVVGIILAKMVRDILHRLLTELPVDKFADTVGLSSFLHKGGVKHKFSGLVSSIVYLVLMVMFLIMSVKVLGITVISGVVDSLVSYVPSVISAVIILALGTLGAKIVASFIHVFTSNINVPGTKTLERVTRWAIILYTYKLAIDELGYGFLLEGQLFFVLFTGVVVALSLAFGLGGRDAASRYLGK